MGRQGATESTAFLENVDTNRTPKEGGLGRRSKRDFSADELHDVASNRRLEAERVRTVVE